MQYISCNPTKYPSRCFKNPIQNMGVVGSSVKRINENIPTIIASPIKCNTFIFFLFIKKMIYYRLCCDYINLIGSIK